MAAFRVRENGHNQRNWTKKSILPFGLLKLSSIPIDSVSDDLDHIGVRQAFSKKRLFGFHVRRGDFATGFIEIISCRLYGIFVHMLSIHRRMAA